MQGKETDVLDSAPLVLPPHLAASFERTDAQLREVYGASPGVTMLVRLWLACATPFRLRQEFERAVLGVNEPTIQPNANGIYDDDCL
jgi:hypothetical protein